MAHVPGGDPWVITTDDRSKHDVQFFQLKPVAGFLSGEKARDFFLKSSLPTPVLGKIWSLADLNADGQMDQKEFSIGVHLIKKKLQGIELPVTLPPSLLAEPVNTRVAGHITGGVPVIGSAPLGGSAMSVGGMVSQPMWGAASLSQHSMPGSQASFGVTMSTPVLAYPSTPTKVAPGGSSGSDWAIPQAQKLKYSQLFNTQDRLRRGYLTGVEARSILMQSGLTHAILAQIWNLADVDNDGKLTSEEFCLAMYLVELASSQQALPQKLPPDLIPPSYRRSRSGSGLLGSAPQGIVAAAAAPGVMTDAAFGDLLGGFAAGMASQPQAAAVPVMPLEPENVAPPETDKFVTFEDRRKENFDKGQAELEKRRARLREQQQAETEARLAAEKAEQEKRERIRQEQEEKRQAELERQMERQRQLEQQREEQRRKALEQREAARRELEQQRQLEWERQRRDQLIVDKQREQAQVDEIQAQVAMLKVQLEALDRKKVDLGGKTDQSRTGVTDITQTIESMRHTRDSKLSDIERFDTELQEWTQKLSVITQEKQKLAAEVQAQNAAIDDTFRTVQHSYQSKQQTIARLRSKLQQIESDTSTKLEQIDSANVELSELKKRLSQLQQSRDRSRQDSLLKANSTTVNTDKFASNGFTSQSTSWANSFFDNHPKEKEAVVSSTPIASDAADKSTEKSIEKSAEKSADKSDGIYQALYQFEARSPDELSFVPGDIIWVKADQSDAEEGWLGGRKEDGNSGWFPAAYAAPVPEAEAAAYRQQQQQQQSAHAAEPVQNNLFGNSFKSSEADTNQNSHVLMTSRQSSFTAVQASSLDMLPDSEAQVSGRLQARALYPWKAKKDNHMTFNKDDIITVTEQQDMWWCGQLGSESGWFPKSYVKLLDSSDNTEVTSSSSTTTPHINESSTPGVGAQTPVDSANMAAEPEYYVAMYTYSSCEPGDLTFTQGEVMTVTVKDGDWWTGSIGERRGIFPANYVKQVDAQDLNKETGAAPGGSQLEVGQKSTKKPEIASVLAPYQATGPEQLSLKVGQLIQVRKKSPSGWWEGELQARGKKRQIGWFPANYVKMLGGGSSARSTPDSQAQRASSLSVSSYSSALSTSPLPDGGSRSATPISYPAPTMAPSVEQVVALYSYTAQKDDELTFVKDSVINVLGKEDPDWWHCELNGASGVVPSNYVTALSMSPSTQSPAPVSWMEDGASAEAVTTAMEAKRQKHIHELINTEETYLQDLSIVFDVFCKPLREENVLSDDQLQTVFVNLNEIIMCNTKLVKAMRVRKKLSGKGQAIQIIGDILCENLPHMTPYIRFCSCQLNAGTLIQHLNDTSSKFKEVSKRSVADPRAKGMPISSYLLKPMQRITKYPLLIEKILQYTDQSHPDRQNLEEALAKASEICNQVNEGVKERDNSDKLEWIQNHVQCDGLPEKLTFNSVTNCLGPRKFITSGTLYKSKSNKELVGFLFNDFILLTQPQHSLGSITSVFSFDIKANTQFKLYRDPIFLNEVAVKKPAEADTENTLFHLSHIGRMYSFKAVSAMERDSWVKKIDEASQSYMATEKKKLEKAYAARKVPAVGRLLVVVQEGCNLQLGEQGKSDPYCEVSMGMQEHKTRVLNNTLNPKWNSSMQFTIKDLHEDVLCITVYDRDLFTPNDFLGRTEIRIKDISMETGEVKGPIVKTLLLHEVDSGEVVIKLDLQLYDKTT